jgi:hypothetical protein
MGWNSANSIRAPEAHDPLSASIGVHVRLPIAFRSTSASRTARSRRRRAGQQDDDDLIDHTTGENDVIVNMRTSCDIKAVWAQGDCDVPEIRKALRDQN